MTILESLALCCVYLCFFMVFFALCGCVYWLLDKIGFLHWLRGWLWYFGLVDDCPDTKKRNR